MDIVLIEVPDFLTDFNVLRTYCDQLDYSGITNPVDGVFYPGVSVDVPPYVVAQVIRRLEEIDGPIRLNALFFRLSLKGVRAPHQAHTDILMGEKSLMVYMNREEDCKGGTSILKHTTGLSRNPQNEEEMAILERDQNNPSAWLITHMFSMKPNKGFIFDAGLIHRAEPIGGFGETPINGRLVLTAFYDCKTRH